MGSKIYKVLFMLIGIGTLAYMIHAMGFRRFGRIWRKLVGGFCRYWVAGLFFTG
ncbi:hypothetical protein KUH03_04190 [Sphingobacterium sp. E70]|uniref:hypothetical protein n=1 Tax=Sphingobacterium sp. E70 TaxID=2853439 RepID=UPI00211B922B|nr:hypothetical protein [Sphingobacterium sp. E70]ULT29230.1 hypothetical protein KUH03_04190 [Sphingobacterium sp. E70]